jgi:hypothetical protein
VSLSRSCCYELHVYRSLTRVCVVFVESRVRGNKASQYGMGKVNGVLGHEDAVKEHKAASIRLNGSNGKDSHSDSAHREAAIDCRPIPSSLVDVASEICVAILLMRTTEMAGGVVYDAGRLLQRCIVTGDVSSRRLLTPYVLSRLLRVLGRPGITCLTPTDLIIDILKYSKDVSEQHIVTVLRFYLRRVSTREQKSVRAKVSFTFPLKGAIAMMERLVSYSDINEALFRSAARGLTSQEVNVTIRILLALLTGRYHSASTTKGCRLRVIRWLGVLSELVPDLSMASDLSVIRRLVADEVKKTESLLYVMEVVDKSVVAVREFSEQLLGHARHAASAQHPPYRIERLVL